MKYILIIFFTIASIAFAEAQTIHEVYVGNLHKKKFEWLIENKQDSLAKYLDENLTYIHSNGWIQSKAEVLQDITAGKLIYRSIVVKDYKTQQHDNTIVVTGNGIFAVGMNETAVTIELMYTEVYVKKRSNWKLVARHALRTPPTKN